MNIQLYKKKKLILHTTFKKHDKTTEITFYIDLEHELKNNSTSSVGKYKKCY